MSPLRAFNVAQAADRREEGASQSHRTTPAGETRNNNEGGNLKSKEWQEIEETLIQIREGLKKEAVSQQLTQELSRVIKRIS